MTNHGYVSNPLHVTRNHCSEVAIYFPLINTLGKIVSVVYCGLNSSLAILNKDLFKKKEFLRIPMAYIIIMLL